MSINIAGNAAVSLPNFQRNPFKPKSVLRCNAISIPPSSISRLCIISVAELVANSAHCPLDRDCRRIDTHVNEVFERRVGRRREVEESVGAADGVLTVLEVLVLPD